MEEHKAYSEYLRSRKKISYIYKKFWLYPILNKYLNGKVLDVGCGIGDFLSFRKGTIGIDINENNVDFCLKRGLNAKMIKSGVFPVGDSQIDAVIMDNVLEHIIDPTQVLSEIKRVIKKGGNFVIGVPGIKGYQADPDHKKFYKEKNLIELLNGYNFRLIKFLHAPLMIKSTFLDKKIRQYCIYGVFEFTDPN
ncbi:MAG: class I SAM-dependent methyltransferase [Bacteroidota bacterium]